MENKYYVTDENQIIDTTSGEIIRFEDIKKAKEQKIIDKFLETQSELASIGSGTELILLKYKNKEYNCVSIKKNYTYNKEFRVEMRDIMKSKQLSKNARLFIGTMTSFVSFPSNSILIDFKNPTIEDLVNIVGINKNLISEALKDLEYHQITKRVKVNGQMIIYFNPFLVCSGYCVDHIVYELFKDSIYNPINI